MNRMNGREGGPMDGTPSYVNMLSLFWWSEVHMLLSSRLLEDRGTIQEVERGQIGLYFTMTVSIV